MVTSEGVMGNGLELEVRKLHLNVRRTIFNLRLNVGAGCPERP